MQKFIFPKLSQIGLVALAAYLYLFTNLVDAVPVNNAISQKQNIIFLVSDGMGAASVQLARTFKQVRDDLEFNDILDLDQYLVGTFRTRSNSSYVTDSAAAGTALASGHKTYNGAINVDPETKTPLGTIGEALKLQGYKVGIVVTTRVTDATPCVWSSHALLRGQEDLIAEQMLGIGHPLGQVNDLILGGGRNFFTPLNVEGGARPDNRSLVEEIKANGTWTYAGNREEFDALAGGENVTLPLLGLFAEEDIPYKIDRDESIYPSLVEEVQVALTALTKATEDQEKGFFLMIEASRPDHAGHANDAQSIAREVLEFNDVIDLVHQYVQNATTNTVVVSTADHETGGLSVFGTSPKDYSAIFNATHSSQYLAKEIEDFVNKDDEGALINFIKTETLEKGLGLSSYTDDEVQRVQKNVGTSKLAPTIANLTSARSKVSWGTDGHSAIDVDIYSFSNTPYLSHKVLNTKDGLGGAHENTDFSIFIKSIAGIDLDEVTDLVSNITVNSTVPSGGD
ncbi:vacuolar alkaline phosphatase [Scheffersomyces amazonensis]|uniref:vacuolar alkaline phosphatase n=1 Tax=Scheffersomyces amazonensis TaxID=1078765 RepID=UPI00315DFE88